MINLGPFMSFLLISYIGNNENPPTDEICWSLDVRYCGASLYVIAPHVLSGVFVAVVVNQFSCLSGSGFSDGSSETLSEGPSPAKKSRKIRGHSSSSSSSSSPASKAQKKKRPSENSVGGVKVGGSGVNNGNFYAKSNACYSTPVSDAAKVQ